jgi:hypothetical protein
LHSFTQKNNLNFDHKDIYLPYYTLLLFIVQIKTAPRGAVFKFQQIDYLQLAGRYFANSEPPLQVQVTPSVAL